LFPRQLATSEVDFFSHEVCKYVALEGVKVKFDEWEVGFILSQKAKDQRQQPGEPFLIIKPMLLIVWKAGECMDCSEGP